MAQDKLGRFVKGTHWRSKKPFWDRKWLEKEYVNNGRTAEDIAKQFSVKGTAIFFWLKKHGIKCRSMSEIRKQKHWGLSGKQNGMYGKTGKQNPNWNGGHSPERQSVYARSAWKELAKTIFKRDNYVCKKCDAKHKTKVRLVVHHKRQWSKYPKFRFIPSNLITLCENCHKEIHKKKLAGWLIP